MTETPPDFVQLLPPLGDELLADQALDAVGGQQPEDIDQAFSAQADEPWAYGMAWQWDFSSGRFKLDGAGPARVYELDNLKIWAQTQTLIGRNSHPIYDDEIGMDGGWGSSTGGVGIGELANDPVVQEQYMQALFDALMVHDRITDVTEFDFSLDPTDSEALRVDFEIHTDDGDVLPLSMQISES